MPRGQKSKVRAREKRHQGRGEAQGVRGAPAAAPAAAEEEPPCAPPGSPEEAVPSSPPQGGSAPGFSGPGSPGLPGDQGAENPATAAAPAAPLAAPRAAPRVALRAIRKNPLIRKVGMLVQFLLGKHSSGEPITRAALLKIVGRKYGEHFAEIFKLTSQRMQLVFGLEVREVDARGQSYRLVSKLALPGEGTLGGGSKGLPKSGLLMALLGVIFMKGNRASEEEVWEFLNVLGVQEGRRHLVFGEPRKFITEDLVRQGYLEYRRVPASDPPRHEFLWGPRARVETSKMQVLQVMAKINDTLPRCFPQLYEEALLEEEERVVGRSRRRF